MEKFRNKYRIESNRMPGWDYAGNGSYFITIVTNGRVNWFGGIFNDKMILSDFGKIVNDEWIKSFEIRNELFMNEFIIMPNHLHAIVILKKPVNTDHSNDLNDLIVEMHGRASLQSNTQSTNQSNDQSNDINPVFQRKPKSISSFVAGFKSATTNKIDDFIDANNLDILKFNKNNRLWQPNYHDHIIRNKSEYHSIKNYIINNPVKWDEDKFNEGNN